MRAARAEPRIRYGAPARFSPGLSAGAGGSGGGESSSARFLNLTSVGPPEWIWSAMRPRFAAAGSSMSAVTWPFSARRMREPVATIS